MLQKIDELHQNNPQEYWNLIRDISDKKLVDNGNAISASCWLTHFLTLNNVKDSFKQRIAVLEKQVSQLETRTCFNELDFQISESEISKAISGLKCNKSPGLDRISNHMLKYGQSSLLASLKKLFNCCLVNGRYPRQWTDGLITVLHKSGNTNDPNNYRGITITNTIGKLFNSILNSRLDKYLSEHNVISDCQLGFTRSARTSDHMFILRNIIETYCHTKDGRVYACFVDFRKAFDTVIHSGLKYKLLKLCIGTKFYNLIKSMYSQSKSCIIMKNSHTEFFDIKLGVKQGDNLSPTLFKIFINDLPEYLLHTPNPILLNDKEINCLMYADDVILLSLTEVGLQSKLHKLQSFCNDWCLEVNVSKTKILIFNKAGRLIKKEFRLFDQVLESVSSYRYLGVLFSASGTFSYAQEDLYKKALKAFYKLQKDFLSLKPSVKTSLHVFDHTIKPILLYGCEIWGNINRPSIFLKASKLSVYDIFNNKLKCENLHLKFCKNILGLHRKSANFSTLSELGRLPLHFDIIKSILNYVHRLECLDMSFPLLRAAYFQSKINWSKSIPSWYGTFSRIAEILDLNNNIFSNKTQTFKGKCKKIFNFILYE